MTIYQPLKDNWKIYEDAGFVSDQIKSRVDSEDNYTWAKGYPLIKEEYVEEDPGPWTDRPEYDEDGMPSE